ncbi:MAG: hypothetical protein JST00_24905 [Deltaproteobacteria bacterium]|nr:hypothetical protein [Deltaproteobacteria bacterium]
MARKTRSSRTSLAPPSSGLPGRLPGLGQRRVIALRGNPTVGAAELAPTAPHATVAAEKDSSFPARFWGNRRVRLGMWIAAIASVIFHVWVTPFQFFPDGSGIKGKDVDDELTIPLDILGEEAPPEKPPAPEPVNVNPEDDPNGIKKKPDAGPKPKPDAGPPDAGDDATALQTDAGPLTTFDAGVVPLAEGGAPTDAGDADGGGDAGLVASADASVGPPGANGPRDPASMIGLGSVVTAGPTNVTLMVNVAVIRQHPVGARMGPLLSGIPQWADFMKGSTVKIDPVRDTEWILIFGPSLIHTDRDAIYVRYTLPDDVVDNAIEAIGKRYDKGGPFDAGVPGVKASLGHADNAERVFMRVLPKLALVVPKDKANAFAAATKRSAPRGPRSGEAMRLIVNDPYRQVSIPGLKFSQSLKQLRLWVVPRAADGGADLFIEGDCTDEAAAVEVADALTDLIKRQNTIAVRLATRGLLNNVKVDPDGTHIKTSLTVSRDQLEALLQTIAAFLNVQVQGAGP